MRSRRISVQHRDDLSSDDNRQRDSMPGAGILCENRQRGLTAALLAPRFDSGARNGDTAGHDGACETGGLKVEILDGTFTGEACEAMNAQLVTSYDEQCRALDLPAGTLRECIEHFTERSCLVEATNGVEETCRVGQFALQRVGSRAIDCCGDSCLNLCVSGCQLGDDDVLGLCTGHALHIVDLGRRQTPRVLYFGLCCPVRFVALGTRGAPHLVELCLQSCAKLADLSLRGAPNVPGLSLRRLAQLGDLLVGLTANLQSSSLRGLLYRPVAVLDCRALNLLDPPPCALVKLGDLGLCVRLPAHVGRSGLSGLP